MGRRRKRKKEEKERERERTFGHIILNGMPPSNSSCRAQGEEERGGVGVENIKRIESSRSEHSSYDPSEIEAASTGPTLVCTTSSAYVLYSFVFLWDS